MLLDLVPIQKIQHLKQMIDILHERSKEIFQAKRAAIERGDEMILHMVGEGKDVMSILRTCILPVEYVLMMAHGPYSLAVKANMAAEEEDKLPDDELLAQMA